jgi:hypothetical protein
MRMVLQSDRCRECLTEMKESSEQIHREIVKSITDNMTLINNRVDSKLAQMDDKATIFFENQERKHDKMIGMVKWWIGVSLTLTLALGGGFGMYAFKIETLSNEKANKKDVPTMNEIRMLRELGDQYNRSIFVKKEKVTADTSAYFWSKKNIYGSELRGSKIYN